MSLFGSSGIRGRVGEEMTVDLVTMIGGAVGNEYDEVVMGNDPRTTADLMRNALVAGATSMGSNVHYAGMIPTPTLARAARTYDCGIMITASHNPPEYNGAKLWNPDGSSFDDLQTERIERWIEENRKGGARWDRVGRFHPHYGAIDDHIGSILETVERGSINVVVDCGNGATCNVTPRLLREMGCMVTTINAQPDGNFPGRSPEPIEENLDDLMGLVRKKGADLGIAHDGDGDRMVAVDEGGRFVSGDVLLALFASRAEGGIAAPIDASMVLDDMVDGPVVRTRVGDVFVSQALKRDGLEFGGEPSGTYIFSRQTYCPDGVYAAALLTSMVSEAPLSRMVEDLPSYPVGRLSFSFRPELRGAIDERLFELMEGVDCDRLITLDGFRAEFQEGWFLIRLSGTEPKMRVSAEGRDQASLEWLLDIAESVVGRCLQ